MIPHVPPKGVTWVVQAYEKGIIMKRIIRVQECDATDDDSSNSVG